MSTDNNNINGSSSLTPQHRGTRRISFEEIIADTRSALRRVGSNLQAVDNQRVRIAYLCASATGISGVCLIASIYSFAQIETPVPPNPKDLVDANPDLVYIPPEVEYVSDAWSVFAATVYGLVAVAAAFMLLRRFHMLFKTLFKDASVSAIIKRSSSFLSKMSKDNLPNVHDEANDSVAAQTTIENKTARRTKRSTLAQAAKTLIETSDKFEIAGEWFWYRHVASETLEVTMQLLQLISFGGSAWSVSGEDASVVKPPATIMAQACLVAFNITFAPVIYFYQNRLIALAGDVLSDIGFVLVQLSAISSVQNPRSWHVLRATTFITLISSVFPFAQSLHDIHSMWDYLMLSSLERARCNQKNRAFSKVRIAMAWLLCLSFSITLVAFTGYQEFGWDCNSEVVNFDQDCHIKIHPLLSFPACDCRMVHLTPDEDCAIPIVERIKSYERVEYFSSAPSEWLQSCGMEFGQAELTALEQYGNSLISVMLPNTDGVTEIDLRGLSSLQVLSVTFDSVRTITEGFIRDSPKLRFLTFEINEIEMLPANIGDLEQLEELVLNVNPICSNATALEQFTSVPIVCAASGSGTGGSCTSRDGGAVDNAESLVIRACQQLATTGYTNECKPQCPAVVLSMGIADTNRDGLLSHSELLSASQLFGFTTSITEEELSCILNLCPAIRANGSSVSPSTDISFLALTGLGGITTCRDCR
ncbi:hypothetical protein FOL47_006111 [Perkinsus chesapeaki]|uniref:EF-hand domain-containing protein n=1 Tax=Perkinsus chesapeaki TaxID=330153 RepID=A0A7J6MY19_PERCH|nr:hypothetical protein FOL47_006111 [Perkinsus chesapeaki]